MPAVTVLPLAITSVGSALPGTDSHLLDTMSTSDGVSDDDSPPSLTEREASKPDENSTETATEPAKEESEPEKISDGEKKDASSGGTQSPTQSSGSYQQGLPAQSTPQQPGYYAPYQSQATPEPPSPAGPGGTTIYDPGSFFQQPAGFHNSPFAAHQYGLDASQGQPQAPNSPSQSSMGGIPPASPIFSRISGQGAAGLLDPHRMLDGSVPQRGAPLSPGLPYLSPQLGPSGAMYLYGGPAQNVTTNSSSNGSPEDASAWGDNRNPHVSPYPPNSPLVSAQGIPIPYVPGMPPAPSTGRSYSFEDNMGPPSAESQQQQREFAQYGANQNNPGAMAGNTYAHQQPWGYGGPPPDMYGASASPLQPRPNMPYQGMQGGPPRPHGPPPMGPYGGQFYPATSPGPPIQTTASNKGPDGANLFIFHIPNHFTNYDMFQLFARYGNLLSVRIMVEKDTGRSRGFGFVSYDSPEAAAYAIKELNGFAIGNKRLKVQHKQIRPSDQNQDRSNSHDHNSGYEGGGRQGGGYGRGNVSPSLPPSGPMASSGWYNNQVPHGGPPDGMQGAGPRMDVPLEEVNAGLAPPPEANSGADALSTMDPLRQALPDAGSGGEELK